MSLQLRAVGDPVATETPRNEGRVYERKPCAVPTSCQPAASQEMRWKAIIRDVSQGGVRLNLQRRFERGSGLAVELPGKDGQEPYTVFAKVMYVRSEEDGTWALGCKFLSDLSEDELDRLVNFSPETANPFVVPDARLVIEAPDGRIVRCRIKRLGISEAWPLPPGQTIGLRGQRSDGTSWTERFEVSACELVDNAWTVRLRALGATLALLDSLGR